MITWEEKKGSSEKEWNDKAFWKVTVTYQPHGFKESKSSTHTSSALGPWGVSSAKGPAAYSLA